VVNLGPFPVTFHLLGGGGDFPNHDSSFYLMNN